jgi:hypothetical protein
VGAKAEATPLSRTPTSQRATYGESATVPGRQTFYGEASAEPMSKVAVR